MRKEVAFLRLSLPRAWDCVQGKQSASTTRRGVFFGWLKDSRSHRYYPAWQIYQKELLPGLAQVLAVLKAKELRPLAIIGYFLTPSYGLGEHRPLDMLREGKAPMWCSDAERYGDIGAI